MAVYTQFHEFILHDILVISSLKNRDLKNIPIAIEWFVVP